MDTQKERNIGSLYGSLGLSSSPFELQDIVNQQRFPYSSESGPPSPSHLFAFIIPPVDLDFPTS